MTAEVPSSLGPLTRTKIIKQSQKEGVILKFWQFLHFLDEAGFGKLYSFTCVNIFGIDSNPVEIIDKMNGKT